MWEAAIQLKLVSARKADALVAQGKTVGAWMAEQTSDGVRHRNRHPRKSFDKLLLLALLLFNLLALAAIASVITWSLRAIF